MRIAHSFAKHTLTNLVSKRILETFAKQNGFTNLRWYTDDGYSGANFQRPGFQAMLADIEAGKWVRSSLICTLFTGQPVRRVFSYAIFL